MSIANTNTNTSAYNLEDEELYLESYLKRTTAFSIERKQDGDDANATAPVNWDDDDDQHKHQHQHHRNDETKTDTRKNNNNNDDDFVGRRVYCCNTSRSLYCPECCRVLIPNKFLPKRFIREQQRQPQPQPQQYNANSTKCAYSNSSRTGGCRRQRRLQSSSSSPFPFQSMDIVLGVKERRTSSTGIQLMCISKMISESMKSKSSSSSSSSSSQKVQNHCYQQPRQQRQQQQQGGCDVTESETKPLPPSSSSSYQDDDDVGKIIDNDGCSTTTSTDKNSNGNGNEWWRNITLYDLNRGDTLPEYSSNSSTNTVPGTEKKSYDGVDNDSGNNNSEDSLSAATVPDDEGTYVLFPQEGKSVPISSVAHKIKRLIVLDIKWTRSYNVRLFSADHHKTAAAAAATTTTTVLAGGGEKTTTTTARINPLSPLEDLPFVHLEFPPQKSHFWRWHNRGDGMLSTIEAIYFAAREVAVALAAHQQHKHEHQKRGDVDVNVIDKDNDNEEEIDHDGDSDSSTDDSNDNGRRQQESFVHILWLFALQRSIIGERSIQEGRPVAFSEEAKALARALRKQHQQDPAGVNR